MEPENTNLGNNTPTNNESSLIQQSSAQPQNVSPSAQPSSEDASMTISTVNSAPLAQSAVPKKSKLLWIIIIILIILLGTGGFFYWQANKDTDKASQPKSTQPVGREEVKDSNGQVIFSMIRPSGWILDQYFPNNTGINPVVLFASADDKSAIEKVALDPKNQDNYVMAARGRVVSAGILKAKSSEQFLALGGVMEKNPSFDISYDPSLSAGTGKCWQVKKSDVYQIQCYITQSGKYVLYTMHSYGGHYAGDKVAFENFMNSIEF